MSNDTAAKPIGFVSPEALKWMQSTTPAGYSTPHVTSTAQGDNVVPVFAAPPAQINLLLARRLTDVEILKAYTRRHGIRLRGGSSRREEVLALARLGEDAFIQINGIKPGATA